MQLSEYKNIFENEGHHFFYVGNCFIILNLIKKYLSNKKNLNILDAGCGTGLLAKKLQIFGSVTGVDINPEAIKYSRKRGIKTHLSSIAKLPFKENTFDLVVCVDVLYHQQVENDVSALKEFKRILKPGGIAIVKVPAYNWLRGSHDKIVHTKHRYTKNELANKAKNAGFKILRASYFTTFLLPFAIIKRIIESITRAHSASDVRATNHTFNSLLVNLYYLEAIILKFISLPFGLSALIVAQKPQAIK